MTVANSRSLPPLTMVGSKQISRRNLRSVLQNVVKGRTLSVAPELRKITFAGKVVARALVRAGVDTVELARDPLDRWKDTDFTDVKQLLGKNFEGRQNVYGGGSPVGHILQKAETTARFAGAAVDAIRGRSLTRDGYNQNVRRATAGNFTVTHESPHSARITTAPHTRERRKKFPWETVANQRRAAVGAGVLITAGTAGIMKIGLRHSPDGRSVVKGLVNAVQKGAYTVKKKAVEAVGGTMKKPFKYRHVGPNNMSAMPHATEATGTHGPIIEGNFGGKKSHQYPEEGAAPPNPLGIDPFNSRKK